MAAFFMVAGLFRGFSGQFGSLIGLVAAFVAGYFLFAPLHGLVAGGGWVQGEAAQNIAAAIADFILSLVVFGLVRRIVAKFVSFLVPQPMDALAGAVVGLVKGAIVVGVLTGAGLVQTGRFSEGFFAAHSSFVKAMGSLADAYMQGAAN